MSADLGWDGRGRAGGLLLQMWLWAGQGWLSGVGGGRAAVRGGWGGRRQGGR